MSVRFLWTADPKIDDFQGGWKTDQISAILDMFEDHKIYRPEQAETLEMVLLNFWSEFQRISDVTVRLTNRAVSIYTSHVQIDSLLGFFEFSINSYGYVDMQIGRAKAPVFGLNAYTPWDKVRMDVFRIQLNMYVYSVRLGLRI